MQVPPVTPAAGHSAAQVVEATVFLAPVESTQNTVVFKLFNGEHAQKAWLAPRGWRATLGLQIALPAPGLMVAIADCGTVK